MGIPSEYGSREDKTKTTDNDHSTRGDDAMHVHWHLACGQKGKTEHQDQGYVQDKPAKGNGRLHEIDMHRQTTTYLSNQLGRYMV